MNPGTTERPRVSLLARPVTAVIAGSYLLLALLMTQIRLLDTLGYESALAFSLVAAFLGVLLPMKLLRVREEGMGVRPLLLHWLRVSGTGVLLLALPMTVLLLNAFFVRNCAVLDGALFWLLLPVPTVLFTSALFLLLRTVFDRRAGAVYYLLMLLFLLQPFVQIFTRPQLFAYNHVFGMFLGLSWDQTQPPFATLLLYRLSTLTYVLLMLTAAAALQLRRTRRVIAPRQRVRLLTVFVPLLAVLLYFSIASDRLGFSSSYGYLHAELGAEYVDGPVRIIYDSTVVSQEDIVHVAREHRFQLARVCSVLGVRWQGTLTSYMYPDRKSKKRLLGTESSQIARPWRKEMHLSQDYWREALKHEIVHVAAGDFGPYINRAPFLRVLGLTEGLAMAVEWSWGNRTLHQHAAAMQAYDLLPTARQCIGTLGFVGNSSSVSYVASGSLTRWLMDSLGVAVLRRAYAEDDLESATGLSYDEMNRRWRRFLRSVPRAQPDSIATAYAFKRPSLFTALCPRVVTERSREAAEALAERRPGDALRLYRATERMAPNARAAFGMVSALYQRGEMDSVRAMTTRYLRDSGRAFSLYPLQLWLGAAAWAQDDSASADAAFAAMQREKLPGWTTTLSLRMRRALHTRDTVRALLRDVLLGALRREEHEDSLRELRAARLARHLDSAADSGSGNSRPAGAAAPHARAVLLEEWLRLVARDDQGRRRAAGRLAAFPEHAMHRELLVLAGSVYYSLGEADTAATYFQGAYKKTTDLMARRNIEEWLARCAFSAQEKHVQ